MNIRHALIAKLADIPTNVEVPIAAEEAKVLGLDAANFGVAATGWRTLSDGELMVRVGYMYTRWDGFSLRRDFTQATDE